MTSKPEPEIITGVVIGCRQEPDRFTGPVDVMTIDTDQHGRVDIHMTGAWILPEDGQRIRVRAQWRPRGEYWRFMPLRAAAAGEVDPVFEVVEPEQDAAVATPQDATPSPAALRGQLADAQREVDDGGRLLGRALARRDELIRRVYTLRADRDAEAAAVDIPSITGLSRQRLSQIRHGTR